LRRSSCTGTARGRSLRQGTPRWWCAAEDRRSSDTDGGHQRRGHRCTSEFNGRQRVSRSAGRQRNRPVRAPLQGASRKLARPCQSASRSAMCTQPHAEVVVKFLQNQLGSTTWSWSRGTAPTPRWRPPRGGELRVVVEYSRLALECCTVPAGPDGDAGQTAGRCLRVLLRARGRAGPQVLVRCGGQSSHTQCADHRVTLLPKAAYPRRT